MAGRRLKIITYPHPALETAASPVTSFDDGLKVFAEDMYATMKAANGIGLAANQVNVLKQLLIIEIPWGGEKYEKFSERQPWHDRLYCLINPKITAREGTMTYEEGCLSFPEMFGEVERARRVVVQAQDLDGNTQEIEGDDLFSVCLQHEIDHLNGIVFVNHMDEAHAQSIREKMRTKEASV